MTAPVWKMLTAGGPIMVILLLLSILSLALIAAKILQLWPATGGVARRSAATDRWLRGERTEALADLTPARAPADRVLAHAMQGLAAGLSGPALEAELTLLGNEEVASLSAYLRMLYLIAMVAPLLGLLGTVLGMIQSFQDLALAQGSANASVLAGGIWLALLTTAAGLIVAIPAAVAGSLLAVRVDTAAMRIESAVGRLMLRAGTRQDGAPDKAGHLTRRDIDMAGH